MESKKADPLGQTSATADVISQKGCNAQPAVRVSEALPQPSMRRLDELKAYRNNARTHSPKQVRQLAKSIREFGFIEPVLIDDNGTLIAGHGRVEAAKLLGWDAVPTICIDHLTQVQISAYRIAANRLAELAGWDNEILKLELGQLIECDFDVDLTGFEAADIDVLFLESDSPSAGADRFPERLADEVPVSQAGDLWLLGHHRLYCGDATSDADFNILMGDAKAQMVITDPPYNVPIDGHVCGSGAIKHREFPMASGEMSEEEFTRFLHTVLGHLVKYSADGSIHDIFMDWRHIPELLSAAIPHYGKPKNLCVWNKDNAGMGTFYRSKHELVFVFKNGKGEHINNFELGQNGRYRSNVWDYPGQNTFHKERREELMMHPTVKPVALIADAMRDCSKVSGIILDCFGGSGTTIVAAEKTNRRAYVMELEPSYVDISVLRWQGLTGKNAILERTGRTFAQERKVRRD